MFTALHSRKEGQVLRLQLGGVVQHRPRIEAPFRDGHIIFDAWVTGNKYKLIKNKVTTRESPAGWSRNTITKNG